MVFEPATGSGITDGAITVTVSKNNSAGEDAILNAAIDKATTLLGSSPSSIADHVMVVFPTAIRTGASAYVDWWMSKYVSYIEILA